MSGFYRLLVLIVVLAGLSGCGSSPDSSNQDATTTAQADGDDQGEQDDSQEQTNSPRDRSESKHDELSRAVHSPLDKANAAVAATEAASGQADVEDQDKPKDEE